jgi:hypothetical protein
LIKYFNLFFHNASLFSYDFSHLFKIIIKKSIVLILIFQGILFLNLGCMLNQITKPIIPDSSENEMMKIEKSRLTLQSTSKMEEIVWEFRFFWKTQNEIHLTVKDKANSTIYFEGKIKPEKFMVLTSYPLEPASPQNKWLTEGLDSDSFRTLVFIVQDDSTASKSLESSIRIKKETKYSLNNKFNVR